MKKARITSAELAENLELSLGATIEVHPNTGPEAMHFVEDEGGPCPYFTILATPYVGQPNAFETWYIRADEVEVLS